MRKVLSLSDTSDRFDASSSITPLLEQQKLSHIPVHGLDVLNTNC